jgi:hypothetical protein
MQSQLVRAYSIPTKQCDVHTSDFQILVVRENTTEPVIFQLVLTTAVWLPFRSSSDLHFSNPEKFSPTLTRVPQAMGSPRRG